MHRKALSILMIVLACCIPVAGLCSDYCFEEAGAMYNISPDLLWAISRHEADHNPQEIHWNKNGTYDFGHMQINSSWYSVLGPEIWDSLADPCQSTKAGAWVLAQCIQKYGYNWDAVGCYNAGSLSRNELKREKYAMKIYQVLVKANFNFTEVDNR